LRAFEVSGFDLGSPDSQPGLAAPPIGFAQLGKVEQIQIRMTGSM
jgi:hypothetical protein